MKSTFRTLAAATVVVAMGAAANAATFNLSDENTGRQWTLTEESEGVTLQVRGYDRHENRTTLYENNWWGVSVGDHYQDDGEAVMLSFSENMTLTGLAARFADYGDRYRIWGWNAASSSWDYITRGRLSGNGSAYSVDEVSIDEHYSSRHFWIGTRYGTEFKLTEITAEVSEVPLPAGAALLLTGLGLLGLRRRKS